MAPEERLEAVRLHQDLANRVANVIGPVMDRVARLELQMQRMSKSRWSTKRALHHGLNLPGER